MHEYQVLKSQIAAILERNGFSQVNEELSPDVFGSSYCEYETGIRKFRVVWDGKDGRGIVQERLGDNWQDLGSPVPESTPENFMQSLGALAGEVEKRVRAHRSVDA